MTTVPVVLTNHPALVKVDGEEQIWLISGPASVWVNQTPGGEVRGLSFRVGDMVCEDKINGRVICWTGSVLMIRKADPAQGTLDSGRVLVQVPGKLEFNVI